MSPAARIGEIITTARDLSVRDPEQLNAIIGELGTGDDTARRLSILMADAGGLASHLISMLRDPDTSVSALALTANSLPSSALIEVATRGSLRMRRLARRRMRRLVDTALAGAVLPVIRKRWGDHEAAALLPACDSQTLREYLPALAYTVISWDALIAKHPAVIIQYTRTELEPLTGYAAQEWWDQHAQLLTSLARREPAAALELASLHPDDGLPPQFFGALTELLRADAAQVAELLLAGPPLSSRRYFRLSRAGAQRLAQLDDRTVGALLKALRGSAHASLPLLRAVPPVRRSAVFDLAHDGAVAQGAVIPDSELVLLPYARQPEEARRMRKLQHLQAEPAQIRWLIAFLPFDEAQHELREIAKSPDPDERGDAYRLMVRNAGRTGTAEQLTDLLGWLSKIRNERDPVRCAVLGAVAGLPFRAYSAATLPALDRLIGDALDARDVSNLTRAAVRRTLFRVLWHSVAGRQDNATQEWALAAVQRLTGWSADSVDLGMRIIRTLPRGQEHHVWAALRPLITAYLQRNNPWPLLRLAAVLGQRAWNLPDLQDLLASATRIGTDQSIRQAIELWLDAPAGRAEKVARLIEQDPSVVKIHAVFRVLVRQRPDLLEQHVLRGEALRGRFGSEDAFWAPVVDPRAVRRWNPVQQRLYRSLIASALADRDSSRYSRAQFARTLAALPGGGPDAVADLIAGDDELIAEAALTGLARSTRPDEALPILLSEIDGKRARVVVYGASRCVGYLAPDAAMDVIAPILAAASKVVARKEAAHLLALTQPPGALDALIDAWHRDQEHRDVRIAIVASMVPFLRDQRAMAVLSEAAADSDRFVARAVPAISRESIPPDLRSRFGSLIRTVAAHPDGQTAAMALLTADRWFPWIPDATELIVSRAADLDRAEVWRAAVSCASNPAVWSRSPGLPSELASALIALLAEGPDAGPDRDRPAFRRLEQLVRSWTSAAVPARREPEATRRLSDTLAGADELRPLAARLRLMLASSADVPTDDNGEAPVLIAADLVQGRPLAAAALRRSLPAEDWATRQTQLLIDRLIAREDTASGILAVILTDAAGGKADWSPAWADRLRTLRHHPEPDVRDMSLEIQTASE